MAVEGRRRSSTTWEHKKKRQNRGSWCEALGVGMGCTWRSAGLQGQGLSLRGRHELRGTSQAGC